MVWYSENNMFVRAVEQRFQAREEALAALGLGFVTFLVTAVMVV